MSSLRARNPPFELEAATQTITTILDRLFDFPDEALYTDMPNTLAPADYTLAYTTAYEWVTCSRHKIPNPPIDPRTPIKSIIFPFLEDYFTHLCTKLQDRLTSLRAGSSELAQVYVHLYSNYNRRSVVAGRLFAAAERTLMRDARANGRTWLKCPFLEPSGRSLSIWAEVTDGGPQQGVPASIAEPENRRDWIKHLDEHEREALIADWELPEEAVKGDAVWTSAVTRAEAGQNPVEAPFVSVTAIALRRWRIHVLEPLVDTILETTETRIDREVITMVAQSVKDVGWQKEDDRRKRVEKTLQQAGY